MARIGDQLREMVERTIVGRPGDELASILAGEGDLWIVAAKDIDWSDPRAPEVDAKHVQGFHRGDLWTRIAAANPASIDVTGYPLDDGSWALVFDWKVGTDALHYQPRLDFSATPHRVTLFVKE